MPTLYSHKLLQREKEKASPKPNNTCETFINPTFTTKKLSHLLLHASVSLQKWFNENAPNKGKNILKALEIKLIY